MKRVLIADTDYLSRRALKSQITAFSGDIDIFETDSGDEMLKICKKVSPDIIFTEIPLVGMNALMAVRQVLASDPGINVIIVTAYDYFSYAQEAMAMGLREYILKPADNFRIYSVLKRLLPDVVPKNRSFPEHREQQGRGSAPTDVSIFAGTVENSYIRRLTLGAFKEAQHEGKLLLKYYFDTTANAEELKESLCDFFVVTNRVIKNLTSVSNGRNLAVRLAKIVNEREKGELIRLAMLELDDIIADLDSRGPLNTNELRQRLTVFMSKNTSFALSLEELSSMLGVSTAYLSRKFKEWFGSPFSDYMTTRRMEQAKKLLLTTGESIKNISAKAGYTDYNYFCRVFKKTTGLSPAHYRAAHK